MFTMPMMMSLGEESYTDILMSGVDNFKQIDASNDLLYFCGGNNTFDSNKGCIRVYRRNITSVDLETTLTANDGVSNDFFGTSCAMSADGSFIAVGAPNRNFNKGAVYIFTRSGTSWSQQAILTANDAISSDLFGRDVDINTTGDYVVVSCLGKASVYIFTRSGTSWSQQAKLSVLNNNPRVAINDTGDYVIIGASFENNTGQAYIFTRSGTSWSQQAILTASDGVGGDGFGFSVDINGLGNKVIIGSPHKNSNNGAVYFFSRSGFSWSEESKKTYGINGLFGYFVKINKNGDVAYSSIRSNKIYSSLIKLKKIESLWNITDTYFHSTPTTSLPLKIANDRENNSFLFHGQNDLLLKIVTRI